MKPNGAIELPIASDVTEASVKDAISLIIEQNKEFGGRFTYWELKTASQGFSDAFRISHILNVQNTISLDFQPDEWSLTARYIDFEEKLEMACVVWSPGA